MTIFKCKMCGGTLEFTEGASVATCEYCGTKQTLPRLIDDRKKNLYDRANHFRRNNEFDKAMGIYEMILNEDETDAEAYWSLVLCRYGVEYVEDPISHKRIPTVNRAQYTPVSVDPNYQKALSHADVLQKEIYEQEAKAIDEIQKGILAISQKEEPFDVFICYKETDELGQRTPDSVMAHDLYNELTREGLKVFYARITLEDKLGTAYEPYIFAALNSATVMVVVGTKKENLEAVWVKNEWSRYLSLIKDGAKKTIIPAYKEIEGYDLPNEFMHLQAQDMSKLGAMQDLVHAVKKIAVSNEENIAKVSAGGTDLELLWTRVQALLKEKKWDLADQCCERMLDADMYNAKAYVGKLLAELHLSQMEELEGVEKPFEHKENYQKSVEYANGDLKEQLVAWKDIRNEKRRVREEKAKKIIIKCIRDCCLVVLVGALIYVGYYVVTTKIIPPQKVEECIDLAKRYAANRNYDDAMKQFSQAFAWDEKYSVGHDDFEVIKDEIWEMYSKAMYEEIVKQFTSGDKNVGLELFDELQERGADKLSDEECEKLRNAYKDALFQDFSVGGIVKFGTYHHQEIEWIILTTESGKALLLSKYALCESEYHTVFTSNWEFSTLYQWLNREFYNTVFNKWQKEMIDLSSETFVTIPSEEDYNRYICNIEGGVGRLYYNQGETVLWWLKGNSNEGVPYINKYGEIEKTRLTNFAKGVRPMIWVKYE